MKSVLLAATFVFSAQPAGATDAWRAWRHLWQAECPSHHVEWMCGDCYLGIVEAFDRTLGDAEAKRADQIADMKRRCASEVGGFGCETTRSLIAYQHLGLMRRFADFSCKVVKCEEPSICSRLPPDPWIGG